MKSLEHLIRDIQEGKTEKCEKKTLEGSIRKVMSKESSWAAKDSKPVDEHCGCEEEKKKKVSKEDGDKLPGAEDKMDEAIGTIGTDKYQGNEFKSIRTATPHIKPPAGPDSHSQAPENVSRQRSIAKEKAGINRVEEGLVDFAAKTIYGVAKPYVASTSRALVKYGEKAVEKLTTKAAPQLAKPAEKLGLPAPEVAAKVETKVAPKTAPKLPEVKPAELKPAEVKPEVKPEVKAAEVKPAEVKVEPKAAVATTTKTPVTTTEPKAVTVAQPKAVTTTTTKTPTKTATPVPPPPKAPGGGGGGKKPPFKFRLPRLGGISGPEYVGAPSIQAPTKIHTTKKERHFKEAVESGTEVRKKIFDMPIGGERKKTSYVGRPEDDVKGTSEKLSRQGQYKLKIIDEGKKLASIVKKTTKEYESSGKTKVFDRGEDVIIVNPEMNKNTLDTK